MAKRISTFLIIFLFIGGQQAALAQVITPMDLKQAGGNEFFVGKEYGKPLVTINLINGVRKPGVYHVPVDTTLPQLLAYAGGATPLSDLSEIKIRRNPYKKSELVSVDLEKVLSSTTSLPEVKNRDIIHIKQLDSLDKTLKWVTLISAIASVGLSAALIYDVQRRD